MDADESLPQLEYVAYAMCDKGVQRLRRDEVLALLEEVRQRYPVIFGRFINNPRLRFFLSWNAEQHCFLR